MRDEFRKIFINWFCTQYDLTLDELLGHIAVRLKAEDENLQIIRMDMLIDHPLQRQAENLVVEFIERHAMTVQKRKTVFTTYPTRSTDWSLTHIDHLTGRVGEYRVTDRHRVPDLKLRMGLANLLDRWISLLGLLPSDDRHDRRQKIQLTRQKLPAQQCPWSFGLTKQLSSLDKATGDAVSACLYHWERPAMRGQELGKYFGQSLENWEQKNQPLVARNNDNLFEWIIAMKIARSACHSGWRLEKTHNHMEQAKYGDILLSHESHKNFRLRISKGTPKDGNRKDLSNNSVNFLDTVARIGRRHGLNSTGFEPDVVLTFFDQTNSGKVVTFLADAKNNPTGDGADYLRSQIKTAAIYVYSYGEILFHTPKCTLFFWQAALNESNLRIILNEYKNNPQPSLDDVLCINHDALQDQANEWFNLISEKAERALNHTPD